MLNLFAPLRFLLTRCNENKLLRQFEFLKAENAMIRKRVSKKRDDFVHVRPCGGAALRSAAGGSSAQEPENAFHRFVHPRLATLRRIFPGELIGGGGVGAVVDESVKRRLEVLGILQG
jgi:hypothetical protein